MKKKNKNSVISSKPKLLKQNYSSTSTPQNIHQKKLKKNFVRNSHDTNESIESKIDDELQSKFLDIKLHNEQIKQEENKVNHLITKLKREERDINNQHLAFKGQQKLIKARIQAFQNQKNRLDKKVFALMKKEDKINNLEEEIQKKKLEFEELKKKRTQNTNNLESKMGRHLQRQKDLLEIKENLKFLKEEAQEGILDSIIRTAPERKQILDHFENLSKNDVRLSILFKTHLEQIDHLDHSTLALVTSKYGLDSKLDYRKRLESIYEEIDEVQQELTNKKEILSNIKQL